ncbi:hypothetical protein [Chryseolinea lacunae]|uniref:Uncharacterized protein n=1 Tax=Chryseolinea lacunae TaxID=2801331 RepID=A0ABS1L215_9BACT|nr:hypothetical protein [Chryseolinea lacunae]MBL0745568.1 hypothetical protein [Chryseolinea lacunae]
MTRTRTVLIFTAFALLAAAAYYALNTLSTQFQETAAQKQDSLRLEMDRLARALNIRDSLLTASEKIVDETYERELSLFFNALLATFQDIVRTQPMRFEQCDDQVDINIAEIKRWRKVAVKIFNSEFAYKIVYQKLQPLILKEWNTYSYHEKNFIIESLTNGIRYLDEQNIKREKFFLEHGMHFRYRSHLDYFDKKFQDDLPDILDNPFRHSEVQLYRRVQDGAGIRQLKDFLRLVKADLKLPKSGQFNSKNDRFEESITMENGLRTGQWKYIVHDSISFYGKMRPITFRYQSSYVRDKPDGEWLVETAISSSRCYYKAGRITKTIDTYYNRDRLENRFAVRYNHATRLASGFSPQLECPGCPLIKVVTTFSDSETLASTYSDDKLSYQTKYGPVSKYVLSRPIRWCYY